MPTKYDLASAIRFLSIDAIQKANSGHPGMPLGMADIATVLWQDFLRHNPNNSNWINRDRFILSNGHGSMLHYSLLHLTGYKLTIDDLKQFRQMHSKTPGHPEVNLTPGIETTTGPLGQGLANAVGMALAEKFLGAEFNKPGLDLIDHFTYVFAGDGCLMEGISHEVCSFAGTHKLGKLILFWDDNGISIDGETKGWFTDNVAKRFQSYNWHVVENVDGHNYEALHNAIAAAKAVSDQPSLICCKTVIGHGSPNLCGTHHCHGSPLGDKEIAEARAKLEWKHEAFVVPEEIYQAWDAKVQGAKLENAWQELFAQYQIQYPDLARELLRRLSGNLPISWAHEVKKFINKTQIEAESLATRQASQKFLNVLGATLPELFGGSADLTPSNLTYWVGCKHYLHYGVREFGMFAIMNGMVLHGGYIPYGGTFLIFSSYGHNALRMAALMKQRVIYVLTHDSIGLGEDGPTHQPIEQLAMLRMTPNLTVWRPCDVTETAVAWEMAIENKNGPTVLALSRQKLAPQKRSTEVVANIKRGGYILQDCDETPEYILIATGSEVDLAIKTAGLLQAKGKKVRVVSMPATNVFDAQDEKYRESVLPSAVTKRVAIEAAMPDFWYKYVGLQGKIIGINRYGESAPDKDLFEFFGFTAQNIADLVLML